MADYDSDDGFDEFYDKFKSERYEKGFSENNWEEEFNKIPMFMKTAPSEDFNPQEYPELACLKAIIQDEDIDPLEMAQVLKDEGNAFFKEKSYQKAVLSYSAGLRRKCGDRDLNVILLTNRAAAQYYLGNMRSALQDAVAARKLKPDHLKALIRGIQCHVALRHFTSALQWCDDGLKANPTDKTLLELRASADKLKRAAERDSRKAKAQEKKLQGEKEALLAAIMDRGIKLYRPVNPSRRGSDSEEDDEVKRSSLAISELALDGLSSHDATGAQVFLDPEGVLHWPVLFLYPEHQQSDFISAFCENNCFMDHLSVMFGEELPPWDEDRKYSPQNLQLYFEDEEKETLYQMKPELTLLKVLQHKRCFVKAGSPSFIVLVKGSAFWKQYLTGKKLRGL